MRSKADGVIQIKNKGGSWAAVSTSTSAVPAATNTVVNYVTAFSDTDGSLAGQPNLQFDGTTLIANSTLSVAEN